LENLALLFSKPDKAFDTMIIAEINRKSSPLWIILERQNDMDDGRDTFGYNICNTSLFTSLPKNAKTPMIVDDSRGSGKADKNLHGVDLIFPLDRDDVLYIQSTTMNCTRDSDQNYKLSKKLCNSFEKFTKYIEENKVLGRATFVFASLHDFHLNNAAQELIDSQGVKVIKGDDWKNCLWPFLDLQKKSSLQVINDMDQILQDTLFGIGKSLYKLMNEANLLLR
jgi:hypothetical protein